MQQISRKYNTLSVSCQNDRSLNNQAPAWEFPLSTITYGVAVLKSRIPDTQLTTTTCNQNSHAAHTALYSRNIYFYSLLCAGLPDHEHDLVEQSEQEVQTTLYPLLWWLNRPLDSKKPVR